jgi:hypothetical protein
MTKRAAPYEAAPDPHAQLTLRRPDLSQQRPPRTSGHRQHRARPVNGVPHHDPGHGSTDLYARSAVTTAERAAPMVDVYRGVFLVILDETSSSAETASTERLDAGRSSCGC